MLICAIIYKNNHSNEVSHFSVSLNVNVVEENMFLGRPWPPNKKRPPYIERVNSRLAKCLFQNDDDKKSLNCIQNTLCKQLKSSKSSTHRPKRYNKIRRFGQRPFVGN